MRVHTAQAISETRQLKSVWLESRSGDPWKTENTDRRQSIWQPGRRHHLPRSCCRKCRAHPALLHSPIIEQPYYDLTNPEYRLRSFAPYPLAAWAEFTFDGLPIRIGQVVQTMQRVPGVGGVYEPLVVTPAIGVRMEPEARILPLDGSRCRCKVTVHAQAAAEGTVTLKLARWMEARNRQRRSSIATARATPSRCSFPSRRTMPTTGAYTIQAVARSGGHEYKTGWQSVGYTGLRPYNLYSPPQLKTRKMDVKLAPGLRIGYVMGTGDLVPEAIEGLGVAPHLLTAAELASGDLSAWNVIVIGIRAYSARPELTAAQPRLDEFVRQRRNADRPVPERQLPAPLPLSMGRASGARGGRASAGEAAGPGESAAQLAQRHHRRGLRRLGRGARPLLPR